MPRNSAHHRQSRNRILGLVTGVAFGFAAFAASAQTYVCPPGYYFLAGYGCYPFGGYASPPPPPTYYYPAYPYAVPAPPPDYYRAYPYGAPSGGVIFEFGGRDRDRDRGHR